MIYDLALCDHAIRVILDYCHTLKEWRLYHHIVAEPIFNKYGGLARKDFALGSVVGRAHRFWKMFSPEDLESVRRSRMKFALISTCHQM